MGIRNKDGALFFATGLDNTGLKKDSEEAKRYLKDISDFAKGTGRALGAAFSVVALKQFANEIINVRGEMQMLETSFEVLLGGRGVDGFMKELNQFAIDSPLSLTGVANAAQTLLGFNVAAKDVIPTIKALGDISMGNEQRFSSLALAFAQMSSLGKLMGQDLNQMINAGFNPLQEISAQTGKSIAELRKEMESGAITSEMVADAFRSATEEGGKFHGMTQKQAEGIKGLQAQLEGAWQENFNNLGKQSEGLIADAYNVGIAFAENFDTIGKILMNGIALYGAYKVALIAINTLMKEQAAINAMVAASNNVLNKSLAIQFLWTERLQKAKALLNKTMLANPYVLAAAGLAVLGYGMFKLITHQTTAEKQQKKLNESLETEKLKLEALVDSFKRAEQGTDRYRQLKDEINNNYGTYLSNLNIEIDALRTSQNAYRLLSAEIEKNTRAKLRNQFIDENNQEIGKSIGSSYSSLRKRLTGDLGAERGKEVFADIKARIEDATLSDAVDINKYIRSIFEESGKSFSTQARKYYGDVNSILSSKYRLKDVLEEADDIFGDANEETQRAAQDIKQQIEETKTRIASLKQDLADLRSGKTESTDYASDIKQKEDELKKANETLETLTGQSKKIITTAANNASEIARGLLEMELSLNSERIAIMKDGREKRLKESEQEWKEQKAALDKEYAERIAKYKELGKQMPESEKKLFEGRYTVADDARDSRDKSINERYDREFIERTQAVTTIFLNEEEKRREAIKRRYEDEKKWAKEQLEGGSITQDQYVSYTTKIDEAEQHEQRERLLSSINDFKQQESEIIARWDALIADATEQSDAELRERLIAGKEEALGELNAQMLMQSEEWLKLFENMDTMTAQQIQKLINTVRSKAKDLELDPVNLEAIMKRLREAENQVRQKNPFLSLSNSIKEYKAAAEGEAKSDAFRNMARDASASLDQVGSIFSSVTDGLRQMGMAGDEETQKMLNGIGEMIGGAAKLAEGIATGNPAAIVAGGVQLLTSALEVFDKRSREANRTIKQNQEQIERLQDAYEDLERAIDKTYSTKAAALLEDEQRMLEQNRRLIQDNIRAEQSKKKPDKDVIREWEKALKDIDVRIQENKDRIVESLAGTDVMSAINQFAQAYADAWASGESAAKKSADVVKGILRNALINYMSGQLQPEVDRLMQRIADAMRDGRISTYEQNAIDALRNALDKKAAQYEEMMRPYLDEIDIDGVTGELKAAMTEQTGSQLVGLWNMTAMDTREIKEYLKGNPMREVMQGVNNVLSELQAIRLNTGNTASNTVYLEAGLRALHEKLEKIEKNTKQNNSRG